MILNDFVKNPGRLVFFRKPTTKLIKICCILNRKKGEKEIKKSLGLWGKRHPVSGNNPLFIKFLVANSLDTRNKPREQFKRLP